MVLARKDVMNEPLTKHRELLRDHVLAKLYERIAILRYWRRAFRI
jgi:hypothetical protein